MMKTLLFLLIFPVCAVFAQPVANNPGDQTQCQSPVFDLTALDAQITGGGFYDVSYFTSGADAQMNTNAIADPTFFTVSQTYTMIWARVFSPESTSPLAAFTSFQLIFGEMFDYNIPDPLFDCSGTGTFDLTSIIPGLVANPADFEVAFHLTELDAENVADPIVDPTAYSGTNGEILYISIQNLINFDCRAVAPLTLFVGGCDGVDISGQVNLSPSSATCLNGTSLGGMHITLQSGGAIRHAYTNSAGQYSFTYVPVGTAVLDIVSVPDGLTIAMEPGTLDVAENQDIEGADFCLNGTLPTDAAITVLPTAQQPRPGLPTRVNLWIYNNSSASISPEVSLLFDNVRLTVTNTSMSMTENGNELSFTASGLNANSYRMEWVEFLVATPPTADLDDVLVYTASVTVAGDVDMSDNTSVLEQIVVNSYDPNDIACHEGDLISEEQAEGFLHYTIRFQNLGTAEAIDVRVENQLSDFLDWSTFRPIAASHPYFAEMENGLVNFRFNGINLPAESTDALGSNGFVTYEIKPVAGFAIGDVIENSAGIYFDFNEAVVTNTATTQIEQLSTGDFANSLVRMFPNPASDRLFIQSERNIDLVEIFNIDGKKMFSGKATQINVSGLTSGIYLVRITSGIDRVNKKLVIR